MRPLYSLTEEEYSTLNKMGFLYEFYPEATGNYKADVGKKVYFNVYRNKHRNFDVGGMYVSEGEQTFYGLQGQEEPDVSKWVYAITIHVDSKGTPTMTYERKD